MKILTKLSLLFFIGLVYIDIAFCINYDLKLINEYFNINYDDNYIILNDYDTSNVKINFEYIAEVNNYEEYNKQNILFNTFIKDTDDLNNFNYVKTSMKNEKLYFEINYETIFNNNYVEVYMLMKEYNYSNNNDIVICISFDKQIINYDGNYILEFKDYIINFSNISFSDYKYNKVNVERFGNYFYINFPSYKDYMQYKFTIKYASNY
jgi:hypothetical protein